MPSALSPAVPTPPGQPKCRNGSRTGTSAVLSAWAAAQLPGLFTAHWRDTPSPGFSVFNNHVLDLQDCKGATPEFTVCYLCWSELLSIVMELYKSNFAGTILLQTYFIPNWNENKDEVHY